MTEYEKIMRDIKGRLKGWDREHIEDLQAIIKEIPANLPGDPKFYGVDMSDLPSEPIPEDINTGYPVWAMDKNGMCLVGASCDGIESLDEVRGIE